MSTSGGRCDNCGRTHCVCPPGADGADGLDGEPGPPGQTGETGAQGATGPTGPQGPPGMDGSDGNDGADGERGPTGATGATGATGTTGATGLQGAPGMDGNDGEDGETGPPGPSSGPWLPYTPIVGQGAPTLNIAKTVSTASYMRDGSTVTCALVTTLTGAGTAANPVLTNSPTTMRDLNVNRVLGAGFMILHGVVYGMLVLPYSQGILAFLEFSPAITGGYMGATGPNAALQNGDWISFTITYEAL